MTIQASRYRGNRCFFCGPQCVPCTDNMGQPYQGCPRCRVVAHKALPGDVPSCTHCNGTGREPRREGA
jgi:hypothetical protein